MDAFNTFSLKKEISENIFYANGFGMFIDTESTFYYVLDWAGSKVFRYDDNWNFIEYKSYYSYPFHMIVVNNSIYINGEKIYKTDKYLNFIKSGGNGGGLRGIYYNPENNNIYVAMCQNELKRIDIFNLGLKFVDYIDLTPYLTENTIFNSGI